MQQILSNVLNELSCSPDAGDFAIHCKVTHNQTVELLKLMRTIVLPGAFESEPLAKSELDSLTETRLYLTQSKLERAIMGALQCDREKARSLSLEALSRLPRVRELVYSDIRAAYDGDPAAASYEEIVLSYPSLAAVCVYRLAHILYTLKIPLLPRIMTEHAHRRTGIDIHPGAKIGERFFIDHGTGVVIGETCVIGNNVKLYQGVTLGAKSFPLDEHGNPIKGIKRHPNIEDDVIIYANATILGDVTIGHGSVIGGNVWLTKSVPSYTVYANEK